MTRRVTRKLTFFYTALPIPFPHSSGTSNLDVTSAPLGGAGFSDNVRLGGTYAVPPTPSSAPFVPNPRFAPFACFSETRGARGAAFRIPGDSIPGAARGDTIPGLILPLAPNKFAGPSWNVPVPSSVPWKPCACFAAPGLGFVGDGKSRHPPGIVPAGDASGVAPGDPGSSRSPMDRGDAVLVPLIKRERVPAHVHVLQLGAQREERFYVGKGL